MNARAPSDASQRLKEIGEWWLTRPVDTVKTGASPHRVVFRQNKAAVRYFPPAAQAARARHPVFVSMPLINTWTIFDLLPERSIIRALTQAGVPVYLLDWGRPGPEDRDQSLGDLIDGILVRCLQRATRHARAQGHLAENSLLDALGYCVGGTFLAICLSRHPRLARRLALLAAPIDHARSGRLTLWASPETYPLDDLVDGLGNYPPELLKSSFALLKPAGQVAKWKGLWDAWETPGFPELWSALEQWNDDNIAFPGAAYREYVRQCYMNNALIQGGWLLDGQPVDLSQGTVPALVIAATKDHIVPPTAVFGIKRVWGGPVQTRSIRAGHVGVCVRPVSHKSALGRVFTDWSDAA